MYDEKKSRAGCARSLTGLAQPRESPTQCRRVGPYGPMSSSYAFRLGALLVSTPSLSRVEKLPTIPMKGIN